jgi:hypothetical protein
MKYIKTYESFNVSETMDMMFMPVDPIAGAADVYKDIADYLGNEYEKIESKLSSGIDDFLEKLGNKGKEALKSAERFFGKPASEITYELVKNKIAPLLKQNESFGDTYDKTEYDGKPMDSFHRLNDIKGGFIQQLGQIFQDVFTLSVVSLGLPTAWLIELITGSTNFLEMIGGAGGVFIGSIIAWIIVHIIRKLDMMFTNWTNK